MPPIDEAWLRRRYSDDGAPVAEIAAEAGVHPSTIHRALARWGIPARQGPGADTWARVLTRARLKERLTRGDSVRAIARAHGCDPKTVREAIRRHGLDNLVDATHGTTRVTERDLARARLAYESGKTIPEVAELLGCAPRTARSHLLSAGTTLRPRGRRG